MPGSFALREKYPVARLKIPAGTVPVQSFAHELRSHLARSGRARERQGAVSYSREKCTEADAVGLGGIAFFSTMTIHFGLLFATPLALDIVPVLYRLFFGVEFKTFFYL